jgi:DNA-binding NarL/FixJ family response regulator
VTKPRFVFLEDHVLVLEAIKARLAAHYGEMTVVYEGHSVTDALVNMAEQEADCVVLDLDLGDGSHAADNVKVLGASGTPVLIVSAMVEAGTVRRALQAGAIGYVSKQAQLSELLQATDAALRGEQYMSTDIAKILVTAPQSTVQLSEQERKALVLYASGLKLSAVARRMEVSEGTVNEYIKRVRSKYSNAGTPVPTKVHLYKLAQSEGWLE